MKDLSTYSEAFLIDLKKEFNRRLIPIGIDTIEQLSISNYAIANVVSGLCKESYTVQQIGEVDESDYSYRLIYTTHYKGAVQGAILNMHPLLVNRNELTLSFTGYIYKVLGVKDPYNAFNTFQHQQQSLFEQLGFWTFSDELFKGIKGDKFMIAIKSDLPPLYVPFGNKYKDRRNSDKNYVYVMHNRSNNYFKIGRSINPTYREKTLQAQEPDVVLIEKWRASADVEKLLHVMFRAKQIRGEWFNLDSSDLDLIKEFMKEYQSAKGIQ